MCAANMYAAVDAVLTRGACCVLRAGAVIFGIHTGTARGFGSRECREQVITVLQNSVTTFWHPVGHTTDAKAG